MKIKFPEKVKVLLKKLEREGYEGFVVGGAIRDSLLGIEPKDWDIATNALPDAVEDMFIRTIPTGKQYGTISVNLGDEIFEVTTYRLETDYDGRRPNVVEFSDSLLDDLKRRDFTFNAMAMGLDGILIDEFNGQRDLKNGEVNCVGVTQDRIDEDKLRALRAVRFASRYGFHINRRIQREIEDVDLSQLSKERIRDEFNKILLSDRPSVYITFMFNCGLLYKIFGAIYDDKFTIKTFSTQSWIYLDKTKKNLESRLAVFFDIVGSDWYYSGEKMRELKYSNAEISIVETYLLGLHKTPSIEDLCEMKQFISDFGKIDLDELFDLQVITAMRTNNSLEYLSNLYDIRFKVRDILDSKCPLTLRDLIIDGNYLMENYNIEGVEVGIVLNKILKKVWEKPFLNSKIYKKSLVESVI